MLDELAADFAEFRAQERLAAREVQVLDAAQRAREGEDLVLGQVVAPVQVAPVEAVLAFLIADRVDEQNQERRTGLILPVAPGNPCVTGDAAKRVHSVA